MIRVEIIDRNQVNVYWSFVADLLRPSVLMGGLPRSLEQVKQALLKGEMGAATVHFPNGAGIVVLEVGYFEPQGPLVCWMPYIAGQMKHVGPKAWIKRMIELMGIFEAQARNAGCAEMRIGGRDWSFLPGYEQFGGRRNRLRKEL